MACPKDGGSYILICSICGRSANKQVYGELVVRYRIARKLLEEWVEIQHDERDKLTERTKKALLEPP